MKEIIIAYDENTEASPVMGEWVGELVRCKDCKHRIDGCCYNKKRNRINFGVYVAGDWFCADGERR